MLRGLNQAAELDVQPWWRPQREVRFCTSFQLRAMRANRPSAATQDTRLSDAGRYTRGNRCIDRLNRHDKARPIRTRVQFPKRFIPEGRRSIEAGSVVEPKGRVARLLPSTVHGAVPSTWNRLAMAFRCLDTLGQWALDADWSAIRVK